MPPLTWLESDRPESSGEKSSVINGAITSTVCFSTRFGIGSAADDSSGSRQTALISSSAVSGRNCWKERHLSSTNNFLFTYLLTYLLTFNSVDLNFSAGIF